MNSSSEELPAPNCPIVARDRITETVRAMTLDQKIGAMLVARVVVGERGTLWEGRKNESTFGFLPTTEIVETRGIRTLTVMNAPHVDDLAAWTDRVRSVAAGVTNAAPFMIASDPRHGLSKNSSVAQSGGGFTVLPEALGLAATGDIDLVREAFALMARELRAVGIDIVLGPVADLATEPRWSRVLGTFGEDPEWVAALTSAAIAGLQNGPAHERVLATVKHFPGGGPQPDGIDAHFAEGKHTAYPGGHFLTHLEPFVAAIAAGAAQVMPAYAAPLLPDFEPVGFAFQKSVITDLLRTKIGFNGVVMTDFNVVTGMNVPGMGLKLPARAWGLEDLSAPERVARLMEAGVDQFGGEDDGEPLRRAVHEGLVTEQRIDESVARILAARAPFEKPTDVLTSLDVIGERDAVVLARRAQQASIVAVSGEPLHVGPHDRIYFPGGLDSAVPGDLTTVDTPEKATISLIRISAPYEPREGLLESAFHQGSLEFDETVLEEFSSLAESTRLVVDVFCERAAVVGPIVEIAHAVTVTFGVPDEIWVAAVLGRASTTGVLPFDLPASDDAIARSRTDTPFDTEQPVARAGHGLQWRE